MNAWFPPGADPVEHSALVTGIPEWIEEPVGEWVSSLISDGLGFVRGDFLRAWDVAMRNSPTAASRFSGHYASTMWNNLSDDHRVAILDYLLFLRREVYGSEDERAELETLLWAGGSEWRVGKRSGNVGLEKRVPQGVADAAEAIMLSSSTAGSLLSEAWHAAFGRAPDPEDAYEKAIKAVEEAGAHVVCPNNKKATLGTMARDMENQKDWALPLVEDAKHPSRDVVYKMVQSLWAGHESRHGGNGYRKPTPEEAESAVLLAVPLVQWFTSETVARRP